MLSREEFDNLQRLARLRLDDAEAAVLQGHLERILDYVRRLEGLDLEGVPPMVHSAARSLPLRADEAAPGLPRGEALAAAPDVRDGLVRVPRVLKRESS